ncbi:MAG: CsbD family protein [Deltaproteobacteria bacterium]|nr:CsbD family protein [Deltaproteobacteria bacterium]
MNWDTVGGHWKQLKGNVKEKWGRLTDDELDVIEGKKCRLARKLRERYGMEKDEVEKQSANFKKPPRQSSKQQRFTKI